MAGRRGLDLSGPLFFVHKLADTAKPGSLYGVLLGLASRVEGTRTVPFTSAVGTIRTVGHGVGGMGVAVAVGQGCTELEM